MGAFDKAISEGVAAGVRSGFEKAWTDVCDGRDAPEERCPMRLAEGCACYYRAYHEAPFWRRWRMEKPKRPSQDAVLKAFVRQRVAEVVPHALAVKEPS